MEKPAINSRREFLKKLLANEAKTKPYHMKLQFFKNFSEW